MASRTFLTRRTLLLAGFAACAAPGAAYARASRTLRAIEMAQNEAALEAHLLLDAAGPAKAFMLPPPRPRLVVDIVNARLNPDLAAPSAVAEPVTAVRFAQHDSETVRVVFDLARQIAFTGPAAKSEPDGQRLVYRLGAGARRPARRKVVVIDPGHGGKDPGAIAASGLMEKDIVLSAGLALREDLERLGYRVVMTRDADVFVPLERRVEIGRRAGADLFISLHADAAPNGKARGASVYTLSERGADRARLVSARNDWTPEPVRAAATPVARTVILDMAQAQTKNRSADFAQLLVRALTPHTPLLTNTHRQAGFMVLLAPDVPAVLLELGFMTHPGDAKRLADPRTRKTMMRAVASAVEDFFAADASAQLVAMR